MFENNYCFSLPTFPLFSFCLPSPISAQLASIEISFARSQSGGDSGQKSFAFIDYYSKESKILKSTVPDKHILILLFCVVLKVAAAILFIDSFLAFVSVAFFFNISHPWLFCNAWWKKIYKTKRLSISVNRCYSTQSMGSGAVPLRLLLPQQTPMAVILHRLNFWNKIHLPTRIEMSGSTSWHKPDRGVHPLNDSPIKSGVVWVTASFSCGLIAINSVSLRLCVCANVVVFFNNSTIRWFSIMWGDFSLCRLLSEGCWAKCSAEQKYVNKTYATKSKQQMRRAREWLQALPNCWPITLLQFYAFDMHKYFLNLLTKIEWNSGERNTQ